jgi:hypothetical protein
MNMHKNYVHINFMILLRTKNLESICVVCAPLGTAPQVAGPSDKIQTTAKQGKVRFARKGRELRMESAR